MVEIEQELKTASFQIVRFAFVGPKLIGSRETAMHLL
jgi:hypothetical protein